jgi:hypothetical protein
MTKEEEKDLDKLRKRRDIVMMESDKSGKVTIETPDSYIKAANKHIENDAEITEKEEKKIEESFNAHGRVLSRVFRLGEAHNHEARVIEAMTTERVEAPVLHLLGKDHKKGYDQKEGPPRRPVVGASEGPSYRVSNLISRILYEVADKMEGSAESNSTEDMLGSMVDTNEILKEKDIKVTEVTIGSLDVKALYPSLKAKESAQIAKEEIENSIVKIEVNETELTKYLPICMTRADIVKEGLEDVVYKEKGIKDGEDGKVLITDKVMAGGPKARDRFEDKFDVPNRKPTKEEVKRMTALAVRIAIEEVMNNNVYIFNGKTRRQKEGGPIGVELTGGLSRVVMGRWDRMFKNMMTRLMMTIWMFKRYVDDMDLIVKTERNKKLLDGELVDKTENEIEDESEKPDDEITMRLIRTIADDVMKMIQTEEDFPSKHESKLLPILDVQVRVQGREDDPSLAEVSFQFYKKPMAPDRTILFNSAMPMKMKRTTATQEVLRRLLNCSRNICQEVRAKHLSDYMQVLTNSGYPEKFRLEVLKSGEEAYRRLLDKEKAGERRLYRRKTDREDERWKEKRKKKCSWQGNYSGVIFVPYTKDSKLRKDLQQLEERMRVGGREAHKIKVIERAGPTLTGSLIRKDPFGRQKCQDKACFQCTTMTKKPKISCRKNSIGYALFCRICQENKKCVEYIGETGQNALTRGKRHILEFMSRSKTVQDGSAMWKHMTNCHLELVLGKREDPRKFFTMEVRKSYMTPVDRQIDEGNNMKMNKGDIINSKREWHQATLSRTIVVRGGASILDNITE